MPKTGEGEDGNDDDVTCLFTEEASGGDAVQPDQRETVIGFWGSTKAETRMEYIVSTTVLNAEEETATSDPFTRKEFLYVQKEDTFGPERAEWMMTPSHVSNTTGTGY